MSEQVASVKFDHNASIGAGYRYRLRLLTGRARFYKAGDLGLAALGGRGLAMRTGRTDRSGRIEWAITDAGRKAVDRVCATPPSDAADDRTAGRFG